VTVITRDYFVLVVDSCWAWVPTSPTSGVVRLVSLVEKKNTKIPYRVELIHILLFALALLCAA